MKQDNGTDIEEIVEGVLTDKGMTKEDIPSIAKIYFDSFFEHGGFYFTYKKTLKPRGDIRLEYGWRLPMKNMSFCGKEVEISAKENTPIKSFKAISGKIMPFVYLTNGDSNPELFGMDILFGIDIKNGKIEKRPGESDYVKFGDIRDKLPEEVIRSIATYYLNRKP